MVFPILPCSSTCLTGQTGSGKTRFVFQLLKTVKDMYVEAPQNEIIYCLGIHQPLFEEMAKTIPSITLHQGPPSPEVIDQFTADRRHRLIALDDLMHRVAQNCYIPRKVTTAD
jgi:Cdc6-like AAA superfamily ATPase